MKQVFRNTADFVTTLVRRNADVCWVTKQSETWAAAASGLSLQLNVRQHATSDAPQTARKSFNSNYKAHMGPYSFVSFKVVLYK